MANRSTSISELWVSSELVVVSSLCKHDNSGLKIPPQLPACSCGGCRSDELTDRQMDRSESLIHLSFWGQEFHQSLEGDAQDEIWKKIVFFFPPGWSPVCGSTNTNLVGCLSPNQMFVFRPLVPVLLCWFFGFEELNEQLVFLFQKNQRNVRRWPVFHRARLKYSKICRNGRTCCPASEESEGWFCVNTGKTCCCHSQSGQHGIPVNGIKKKPCHIMWK